MPYLLYKVVLQPSNSGKAYPVQEVLGITELRRDAVKHAKADKAHSYQAIPERRAGVVN